MAAAFGVLALVVVGGTGWAVWWAVTTPQVLGIALALILLGISVSVFYEAWALWRGGQTIAQIAHAAFMAHQSRWVAVYLGIAVVVGGLTMHFTRIAQNQHADWVFLATSILVLVNGALIAYWFDWLP